MQVRPRPTCAHTHGEDGRLLPGAFLGTWVLDTQTTAKVLCPRGTLKAHPVREGEAHSELVEALCIPAFYSEVTEYVC